MIDLKKGKRLLADMTNGPWTWDSSGGFADADGEQIHQLVTSTSRIARSCDGKALAWLRNNAEALLLELEHLRWQRDNLQAANTREVERRREAESEVATLRQQISVHNWTHPAEDCDEPDCKHVTVRTCEGAEKVQKFYRRIINNLKERLYKADPNAAKADWNRLMKALDMPEPFFEAEVPRG